MVHSSMEVVHEGMLKKSPPPKRLWRAKWRMRWFVLRAGELPGQYFLEYYTDRTCRKLKGKIDLDQCDQVDAGITFGNRKAEYKYMFDIKTPKRVYYLCAETEQEMNRWVDCVCQVCGLKMYSQEEDFPLPLDQLPVTSNNLSATPPTSVHAVLQDHSQLDSPSLSPTSISGPYIPISECITGKRTPTAGSNFPFNDDLPSLTQGSTDNHRSSIPNEMAPPAPVLCADSHSPSSLAPSFSTGAIPRESFDMQRQLRPSGTTSEETLSVQSPLGTEGSSVFSEDEWALTPAKSEAKFFSDALKGAVSHAYRESHPKDGHRDNQGGASGGTSHVGVGSASTLPNDMRALSLSDNHQKPQVSTVAPPRPPKPAYLTEHPQQTYQNIEAVVKSNLVRRNSSSDNTKNGLGNTLVTHDNVICVSDPEPSPISVTSSVPPSTPSDLTEEGYSHGRSQQPIDSVSPQSLERSKQRISYNNVAIPPGQNHYFSYDMRAHDTNLKQGDADPRTSPGSLYSNVPQANTSPIHPPAIDRGLKPKKTSDGNVGSFEISPPLSGGSLDILSNVGGSPAPPVSAPPAVDRNLKPMKSHADQLKGFKLDPVPLRYKKHDQHTKAAPSPTPPTTGNGRCNSENGDDVEHMSNPNSRRNSTQDEQIFYPLPRHHEIQYTDLDLYLDSRHSPKPSKSSAIKNSTGAAAPSVVYKTIDFVKTEVFNEMKKTVEDTYRKNQ
ncbi:GPI-anchor transamidase subunit gab1 [Halocaridina rubra]|uniref:GPI-anchor transamidase subunit gab1 n=1 Tax=Halocaridina rubra TaxID=373956 RepID=A0AAN8WY55_HALRR